MTSPAIKPWIQVVSLHPDVISDDFSEDIFALDLGALADNQPNVPAVYRDPENFFRASYLTKGLRTLLNDVLSRLSGGKGARVLKLVTPFGGGKSHTLAATYHACQSRTALNVIPEGKSLPYCPKGGVAVFDGLFFDAVNGKAIPGEKFRAKTMWGWIAWSLGEKKGYDLFKNQDEVRVAPGGDEILTLLKEGGPNLILLDEVLNYLISAGGIKVEQTTLRDETLTFLQRLTVAVGNTSNTALVFSLQSSKRESLEYVNLLNMVDHLAARKDQRREPVELDEVLHVIQRRLFSRIPEEADATPAAITYQEIITQMKRSYANTPAEAQQAEEEGISLRNRVRAAYPFHPALIDLMRERWAAIPDFQRTRGALRFLAACLRACHRESKSRLLLGPGDVPLHDAEVRLGFFKEVGQQADFQAVLEHDLIGVNARAKRIDARRAKENPAETGKSPATRVATAILMYSFGGLKREGGKEGDMLPPGVTEAELLSACVSPDLDSTTAIACLKELRDQCLYLHFDGVRYCFKKDPNETLLIEQEADIVARNEQKVTERIKEMLEERLAGHRTAIIWPARSTAIPSQDASFLVGYLPLTFAERPRKEREGQAREFFGMYGDKPRKYRNGLALAVPSREQVGILRRAVRYMMAIEQVRAKAKQYNLTDEQKGRLKEREGTEKAGAESALLKLYSEVWFPKIEDGRIEIDPVSPGGRPLQTTLNEKKQAMIHERLMELITVVHRKVLPPPTPGKVISLFKLGEGQPPLQGLKTTDLIDGFFSFPGFPRILGATALQKTIARAVQEGAFGYFSGPQPTLGPDGRYQVNESKVAYGRTVPEDEIDLDTGFLIMPDAIPRTKPPEPPAPGPIPPSPIPSEPEPPGPGPTPPGPPDAQRTVSISFSANRDQLFGAWQAIANLADMAGKIDVSVSATSEEGFDKNKLRNAVLEPLQEADLIV
ncbi:MAG: DUF499 domain-containing protein [Thermodesulfobacteriota bacterium]